jgi:hypothetical protein
VGLTCFTCRYTRIRAECVRSMLGFGYKKPVSFSASPEWHFPNYRILKLSLRMHLISIVSSLLLFVCSVIACGLHPLHKRTVDRDPQFAPIPPSAASIPIGPGGYGVQHFGKGAYMVTDSNYQGLQTPSCQK